MGKYDQFNGILLQKLIELPIFRQKIARNQKWLQNPMKCLFALDLKSSKYGVIHTWNSIPVQLMAHLRKRNDLFMDADCRNMVDQLKEQSKKITERKKFADALNTEAYTTSWLSVVLNEIKHEEDELKSVLKDMLQDKLANGKTDKETLEVIKMLKEFNDDKIKLGQFMDKLSLDKYAIDSRNMQKRGETDDTTEIYLD